MMDKYGLPIVGYVYTTTAHNGFETKRFQTDWDQANEHADPTSDIDAVVTQFRAHQAIEKVSAINKELLEAQTMGNQLNTPDFLDWVADRLVHVYGEKESIDFVISLRERAKAGRSAIAKAKP